MGLTSGAVSPSIIARPFICMHIFSEPAVVSVSPPVRYAPRLMHYHYDPSLMGLLLSYLWRVC